MDYILEILPTLANGAGMTLKVSFFALLGSVLLGTIIAFILQSSLKSLRHLTDLYIWSMRGTSLLLQLILAFYGLPLIGTIPEHYDTVLSVFTLNHTVYFAEISRGGIQAIPQGQYEAAKVLRLTRSQTVTRIALPQAVKIVLPSVGNEIINLVKDISFIYVLGLGGLLRTDKIATSRDVISVLLVLVGAIYLFPTAVLAVASKKIGKLYQHYK